MLSEYQLKITNLYNVPIVKVSAWLFRWRKVCTSIWKHATLLEARIKTKRHTSPLGTQSITVVKTMHWIEHTKKNRSRKKWKQRWKSVVQTNEQSCIQKNDVKLEKETRCKTRKQRKRLFKMYIKTKLYFVQNIWQ